MKAVILAAGEGTRVYPLTISTPKPLLRILDKTILEHNLEQIKGLVDKVFIVIGYKGEMIKDKIGSEYKGLKVDYIEQKNQLGTGNSLYQAHQIKGRFLVMNGDDLYSEKDIQKLLEHKNAILVDNKKAHRFGAVIGLNKLMNIIEKPIGNNMCQVNTGCYILDNRIFSIIKSKNLLTDAVVDFSTNNDVDIVKVKDYWFPIAYWWDYLEANQFMLEQKQKTRYVGENCHLGRNAVLRDGTIIFDDVRFNGEVVDSVIMSGTIAKHYCYIGHSVIGERCNIGCGTVTADYRHDGKEHIVRINQEKVETERRKLGACFGDNVKTGINTSIYPGVRVWNNRHTLPGEIIRRDIT